MSFTLGSTNTNQQPTATGFGTFGLTSTTNKPTTFGTPAPTGGSLFGNTAQQPSAFGTTSLTTPATGSTGGLFGNTTSLLGNNQSTTGFGSTGLTTQPSTGFNTGFNLGSGTLGTTSLFGQKPATTQPSSLFSFNTPSLNQPVQSNLLNLNTQQQQQQQQTQQNELDPMTFTPKLFNDEHDRILGEFNKLQAYWGFGKGYYAYNKAPTEFNQNQPLQI